MDQRFESFVDGIRRGDPVANIRAGLIGEGRPLPGGDNQVCITYADYTASGRALLQVEQFVLEHVLPFYSNTHSEASFCGEHTNRIRSAAREEIARLCNAGDDHEVIFTGAGATSGLNQIVSLLLGLDRVGGPKEHVVLLGPYEHHSNILPWRESPAEVIEIREGSEGGPDIEVLNNFLRDEYVSGRGRQIIGAFSAASNVSGIVADVPNITRLLKSFGAMAVWDYAAGAPYLNLDMRVGGGLDAIAISPHKFVGGPGASGVLVVKKQAVTRVGPTRPGGGTVSWVSPRSHRYQANLRMREEAGTPNIIGDVRAALAFLVKEAIGIALITRRGGELRERAYAAWRSCESIELLGQQHAASLPIFSFRIRNRGGEVVHHQLVTRILSDKFGIQARGGCSCAGPYGHRLLGISDAVSAELDQRTQDGDELKKPGWVRLNFSYVLSDEKADFIIQSVLSLARNVDSLALNYLVDASTARFTRASADAMDSKVRPRS